MWSLCCCSGGCYVTYCYSCIATCFVTYVMLIRTSVQVQLKVTTKAIAQATIVQHYPGTSIVVNDKIVYLDRNEFLITDIEATKEGNWTKKELDTEVLKVAGIHDERQKDVKIVPIQVVDEGTGASSAEPVNVYSNGVFGIPEVVEHDVLKVSCF